MRALFIALLICMTACAPNPPVDIEYSASTDFTKYRTYSWMQSTGPEGMSPEMYKRLRASLDRSFAGHGYTPANPSEFSVEMALLVQDRIQKEGTGIYGGEYGYSDWGDVRLWSSNDFEAEKNNLHLATFVVVIYDSATKERIWRGSVSQKIIPVDLTPQMVDTIVDAAVAQFPPNIRCTQTAGRYEVCSY